MFSYEMRQKAARDDSNNSDESRPRVGTPSKSGQSMYGSESAKSMRAGNKTDLGKGDKK
jgi:hypothetical protein